MNGITEVAYSIEASNRIYMNTITEFNIEGLYLPVFEIGILDSSHGVALIGMDVISKLNTFIGSSNGLLVLLLMAGDNKQNFVEFTQEFSSLFSEEENRKPLSRSSIKPLRF